MKFSKKFVRDDIKKMKASFSKLDPIKKIDFSNCINCDNDAGNNFILIYKKNNKLKGKLCFSCFKN